MKDDASNTPGEREKDKPESSPSQAVRKVATFIRSSVFQEVDRGRLPRAQAEAVISEVSRALEQELGKRKVSGIGPIKKILKWLISSHLTTHPADLETSMVDIGLSLGDAIVPYGQTRLMGNLTSGFSFATHFTFQTPEKLTVDYLSTQLAPYLQAIASIQAVFDDAHGSEHKPVVIESIVYHNPIGVAVNGVGEVLATLRDWIIPWRRHSQKIMAAIETRKREAEVKKLQAEAMEVRAKSAKERAESKKIDAEAEKLHEEALRLKIENRKLMFDYKKDEAQIALNIVSSLSGSLSDSERLVYASQIMKPLEAITQSSLDIKLIDGKEV